MGPRFWGLDDVIGGGEDLVPAGGRSGAVAADDPDPFGGPNFIVVDGGTAFECDIFEQDCPAGQKCMPWANDGGTSWNATRCSPLDPNPNSVGDPCTVEGSGVSGIDDCDGTSMCFGADPETNMGTCVAFCTCSADNPICEQEGTFCTIANQGVLALCREPCNPLDPQACPADELCVASGGMFVCTPDASGRAGAAGDPCQFLNVCDPGHFCASASVVPDCAGSQACCSAYCEIGDNSNCLQGQDCIPWYGQGEAPDACLAEVGACAIP